MIYHCAFFSFAGFFSCMDVMLSEFIRNKIVLFCVQGQNICRLFGRNRSASCVCVYYIIIPTSNAWILRYCKDYAVSRTDKNRTVKFVL